MRLIPFTFFLLVANFAGGQTRQFSLCQIDSIASTIDTTKSLRTAIADGTIRPKGKRRPQGGFSDTYYLKPTTNQLLKVERDESLFTEDFTTYYFYNDSLILVRTTKRNIKDGKEVLNGRYYFGNGVLLGRQEKGEPLSKPEAYLQHAGFYLKDFKSVYSL